MLSNGRLIILVTKDTEEARAAGPSFSIAALLTNAQKSRPYSYQEACKAAAKIMIKTRRGERAKRTMDNTPLSDNTVGGCRT